MTNSKIHFGGRFLMVSLILRSLVLMFSICLFKVCVMLSNFWSIAYFVG